MEGLTVAIIGGGPGGMLCAAAFAQQGARVRVYERRSKQEQTVPELGWSIALGGVAREALEAAGLSSDFGPSARPEGISHQKGLKDPKFSGQWVGKHLFFAKLENFVSRARIIDHIKLQCDTKYGPRIEYFYQHCLVGGNLHAGEAVFERSASASTGGNGSEASDTCDVQVDLIIAADGAGSFARSLLQRSDARLKVQVEHAVVSHIAFKLPAPPNPAEYADLRTPSGKPFRAMPEDFTKRLEGGFLSLQAPADGACPGIVYFIVNCRDGGDEVNGVLTCSTEWWQQQKRTAEEMQTVLEASFPQLPMLWLLECALVSSQLNPKALLTSKFVYCSKLGSGRCVLVGDAAHAVSPDIGAGATSAMADATLLATCVRSSLEKGGRAAAERISGTWTKERLRDAHALTRISACIHDTRTFRFHRGRLRRWRAALLIGPGALAFMKFPGKSLIAPPPFLDLLVNGGARPAKVERALGATFWKVLALLMACVAICVGATIKGCHAVFYLWQDMHS